MVMTGKYWAHFFHEADVGVRGVGRTKEEAFEQAAIALTNVVTDPDNVVPLESVEITCEAPDDLTLFADWLNSLIYEMSTRKILFSRFDVRIEGERLRALAWGEKVDVDRHEPAVEVKGATYTNLTVSEDEDGNWTAQCVVDV